VTQGHEGDHNFVLPEGAPDPPKKRYAPKPERQGEPMTPLSRRDSFAFQNLSEDEKREYLRCRLHDEAEVWLNYFMRAGIESDRLSSTYLLRPPQR
jgi:hypothetical protein